MKTSMGMSKLEVAERLEAICEAAYSARTVEELDELANEARRIANGEFAYIRDAMLGHSLWIRQILLRKEPERQPGVYVIEYGARRLKIGKTVDFEGRLKQLASMTPVPPSRTFFRPIEVHSKAESLMHRAYAAERTHGEFFEVAFEDAVAKLEAVAKEVLV